MNYYGPSRGGLLLSQSANLVALPKRPNRCNIVRNEKEAYSRRDYVLGRMLEDGYISAAEMQQPRAENLQLRRRGATESVQAHLLAPPRRRRPLPADCRNGPHGGGITPSTTRD